MPLVARASVEGGLGWRVARALALILAVGGAGAALQLRLVLHAAAR